MILHSLGPSERPSSLPPSSQPKPPLGWKSCSSATYSPPQRYPLCTIRPLIVHRMNPTILTKTSYPSPPLGFPTGHTALTGYQSGPSASAASSYPYLRILPLDPLPPTCFQMAWQDVSHKSAWFQWVSGLPNWQSLRSLWQHTFYLCALQDGYAQQKVEPYEDGEMGDQSPWYRRRRGTEEW